MFPIITNLSDKIGSLPVISSNRLPEQNIRDFKKRIAFDHNFGRLAWNHQKAFTLIELLISILIIAILMALSFSAFSKATQRGRSVACLSNMKQIGVAQLMYSNDNDNYFTPARLNSSSGVAYWPQLLLPYLGQELVYYPAEADASVFWCPSAKGEYSSDPLGYVNFAVKRSSYSQNITIGGWDGSAPFHKRTEVLKSSRMVLMTEAGWIAAASSSVDAPGYPPRDGGTYRHGDRINLLFVDSHVETSAYPISPSQGNTKYNWDIGSEEN